MLRKKSNLKETKKPHSLEDFVISFSPDSRHTLVGAHIHNNHKIIKFTMASVKGPRTLILKELAHLTCNLSHAVCSDSIFHALFCQNSYRRGDDLMYGAKFN